MWAIALRYKIGKENPGSRDVRSISTLDIEEFFKWCREPQQGFPHPLGNNSIQKIRTHLLDLWKYMKKNPGKYGVKENVVIDSDYGDISRFEATILNGGVNEFQVSANCGHEYDSKGNSTTVATYWHDDGNRDEIIAFIDKTITAKLKIPDMRV